MGLTVFAEGMGFFHKGSGGTAVAPADVCLSPPPPPTGPVPVPYVNNLQASDLDKGSSTVKIDGEPTALEDASEVSTSTGDEAGTQGGNVITHKTKGKGYFELWSFTVKVEGKGVCRHGDTMGQNAGSPEGCVAPGAMTRFKKLAWVKPTKCTRHYPGNVGTTKKQRDKAKAAKKCWVRKCKKKPSVADHQPPLQLAWYAGGCANPKKFKAWANKASTTKPHCRAHSNSQGGHVGGVKRGDIANTQKRLKAFLAR